MTRISKARLAAEAYFAQPATAAKAAVSVPVVVNHRLGNSGQRGIVGSETVPTAVERERRVFRVAGQVDRTGLVPKRDIEAALPVNGGRASSAAGSMKERRRLMRRPGEVVIVRAAPANSLMEQQGIAPSGEAGHIADRLLLKAPLALLVALLRAVDIEIQRTKASDAAAAIQLIRQAMADHGISLAELRSYGMR